MNGEHTPKSSPRSVVSAQTSPSRYSKATHLTEFYPYLNGGSQIPSVSLQNHTKDVDNSRQSSMKSPTHERRQSLSTMNTYHSFSPSTLDLQTLVTKTDISRTTEAYNDILETSEDYRKALLQVAEAAGNFGAALENGAKCKGSGSAADGLLSASGLYFLVANHQQILAHSVKESFEIPVIKEINKFKLTSAKNDEMFKNEIKEKVTTLKKQERENIKLFKLKSRNLVTYRSKLLQLTSHIDEIDRAKHDYYQSAFDLVQDTSLNILNQLGSIVRAQVEIYEGIARKGWSGGGLDDLITGCPDPFTNDDEDEDEDDNQDQVNGDVQLSSGIPEEDEEHDDDTIEAIPQPKEQPSLTSSVRGLVFNSHSGTVTEPILSHSQSTKSFEKILNQDEVIQSSTPKETTISPSIDDSIDDNSFSLPLPGSSSKINAQRNQPVKGTEADDEENDEPEVDKKVLSDPTIVDRENEHTDEYNDGQPKGHRSDFYGAKNEWLE